MESEKEDSEIFFSIGKYSISYEYGEDPSLLDYYNGNFEKNRMLSW